MVEGKKTTKTTKTAKQSKKTKTPKQSTVITEIIPENEEYQKPIPVKKTRVLFCGTHPNQTNGYSKVVMQLINRMANYEKFDVHLWGFQAHLQDVGRPPISENVQVFNANYEEMKLVKDPSERQKNNMSGFGEKLLTPFLNEQEQYDIIIIYNDIIVSSRMIEGILGASSKSGKEEDTYIKNTKILYYFDQVYQNQIQQIFNFIDQHVYGYIAFTKYWGENITKMSSKPYFVIEHGFSNDMMWKIPKKLSRQFWNIPEEEFVILNLNRNQPRKRWDLCIMAYVHLLKTLRNKRLKKEDKEPIVSPNDFVDKTLDDMPTDSDSDSDSDINILDTKEIYEEKMKYNDTNIRLFVGTRLNQIFDIRQIYFQELKRNGLDLSEYNGRIQFIGDRGQMLSDFDINVLYNVADLGINTADGEGFGLCNFEQGCLTIPQVVTLTGGFKDFISKKWCNWAPPTVQYYRNKSPMDGIFGLAEVSDYKEFSQCMLDYIQNEDLRETHGKEFKEFCVKNFNWDDIVAHLMENLQLLVENKPFKILRDREYLELLEQEDIVEKYYTNRFDKCTYCKVDHKEYDFLKKQSQSQS